MLHTEPYRDALGRWPPEGRHILAQFDANSIVVYQAYNEEIAAAAVADQRLGRGGFAMGRMSWIKPNFLWMMYRSGWATKPNQERVLAIRIPRARFLEILDAAVASSFSASPAEDELAWRGTVATSDVRLQWDPDHAPDGTPQPRRAVQLGLRGEVLRRFVAEWVLEIEDVTAFVREQRANLRTGSLSVATERVLDVPPETARRIGLDGQ